MRPLSKPLRWVVRVCVACYVLYLIAGNVFLDTPLGPRVVNQRPQGFRMTWSWGFTPWPGWVYLRAPSLQGHARRKLWSVAADSAHGRIALLPLLRRQLVFANIHAGDVRVHVRRAASLRLPPPWTPQAWTVAFHGIRTGSLRQVQWYGLAFDGRATADVGFSHQLRGGPTEVLPSHVQVEQGQLAYQGQRLLDTMTLDMRGHIAPFRHGRPPGLHKLGQMQASLSLDAATPALTPTAPGGLRHWLGDASSARAAGRLHAVLAIDDGALRDGGMLRWDVPLAIADPDGRLHQVPAHVNLQVQPAGWQVLARVESSPGDTTRQARAELHYAGRRWLGVSPREVLKRIDGTLQVHWHFASLGWLGPLLARDWLQLAGDGRVDAELRLAHGVLLPGSTVDVPAADLRARVFDNTFAGRAHARATVGTGDDPVALSIHADRYTLAAAGHPEAVYLHGSDLAIELHSTAELARLAREAHGRLRFRDARIPDLRSYNRYLPGNSVRILGGRGRSRADLTLASGGVVTAGTLHLDGEGLDLALGTSRLRADLALDARLAQGHATAPRHYALPSFGVTLRHVRLDDADDPDWWASASLHNGALDWSEPFRLRGDARLQMKDASVLLALFAKRHAFPAWIAHIVDDGRMEATGKLAVGKRDDGRQRFVLDDVRAHNQRVDLKARLRILDGAPDGALYARWGILGLGVALKGGQRDFHLVGASKWYDAQPPLIEPDASSGAAPR